jgi:hypothetical protein
MSLWAASPQPIDLPVVSSQADSKLLIVNDIKGIIASLVDIR